MRTILLAYLLVFGRVAFTQAEFLGPYFEFSDGEEMRVLNITSVYKNPYLDSEIIEKLPIGSLVKIISKTEYLSVENDNKAPFYKISYLNKKTEQIGFVWGGDISLKVENYSKNKKLRFLFGVSRVIPFNEKDNKKGELYLVCKIMSPKKLVSQVEFKSIGHFDNYRILNIYDNKKLKGIKNVLSFGYRNIFNSGMYGEQVFFWNGSKILPVRDIENIGDPPCYYTEELIFPKDNNGKKGYILMRSENGCNEGEQKIETKISEFVWQKNRLILKQESKID